MIVVAEIEGRGACYKLIVNGGVALFDDSGGEAVSAGKLNPYLIEGGQNTVELLVAPSAGSGAVLDDAMVRLRIAAAAHGALSKQATVLHEHVWTHRDDPWPGGGYESVHETPVASAVSHGRWEWQDATPFTDADVPAITALVKAIHQAFAGKSYDALAALTPVRDAEMARGLDVSASDLDAHARSAAEGWFAEPDYEFFAYDETELRFHPRAEGKLVEVTDMVGRAPLRGVVGGSQVRPPFTVSHLPAGWTVVR